MKVLLIHNYLRPPSGENTVFEAERNLLQKNRVELITFEKNNAEIEEYSLAKKFIIPFRVIWSIRSKKQLGDLIKRDRPDIAHFHNVFPLISPSAYYACQENSVPVVQTLHNHKLFCPGGYFLRENTICQDCVNKSLLNSVLHGCYRKSKIQTSGFATMLLVHRALGTWHKKIDCYITLTDFAKKLYSKAGLSEKHIVVKPNFIPDPILANKSSENYGIFVGRLGQEKGIEYLFRALRSIQNASFKVVGDGPARNEIVRLKNNYKLDNTEMLGYKTQDETLDLLGRSAFLVLPSIWYEGFPMVILEAMSLGKPVITTNLGGLPEIIKDGFNGFVVPPQDTETLAEKMRILYENKDLCEQMGNNARKEYEEKYTPEKNYEMLMDIYREVIERKASR